jgi:UrcA family protein
MFKLMTAVALAATLTAGAANAQGASSAEGGDTYSVAVRSGDLNLGSAGGLATFRGRVQHVAEQTCGASKVSPLVEATQIAQCRARFLRSAEARATIAAAQQDTRVAGTR